MESRQEVVRRKIEALADECTINGEADGPDSVAAADRLVRRLLEQPRLLAAAVKIESSDRVLSSRLDTPLISGKRIGSATRPEIRKSARICRALARAMEA
jgi:hypothetical protein